MTHFDLWRYPFLPTAQREVAEVPLEELLGDPLYREARELGITRLECAVQGGTIPVDEGVGGLGLPRTPHDRRNQLLGYLVARLIVASAALPALTRQVALAEAVRVQQFLENESPQTVARLAQALGVAVTTAGDACRVPCGDYLTAAGALRDGEWKLVNRGVCDGRVTLTRAELRRLMREVVRKRQEQLPAPLPEVAERFEATITQLTTIIEVRRQAALKELGRLDLGKAPPCFAHHTGALREGVNLSHPARFFLTTFLRAIGMEPDGIMEVFATAPDFNEARTRYQVDHITGQSSGTEYDVPVCDSLNTNGVCPGGNALCREIIHPLSYYRTMGESEKPALVQRERLLLASLKAADAPVAALGPHVELFGQLLLHPPRKLADASLADARTSEEAVRVKVTVAHFHARHEKFSRATKEERITYGVARLSDASGTAETLALTDWRLALPLAAAHAAGHEVTLSVLPVRLQVASDQRTRLHVLGVEP